MKDIILIEASSKSTYQRKYKCPYCEQKFERTKLHIHIQNKHEELIPEEYTALRVAFNTINNKTEGHCIMCGKVSDWNEDKGRYERLCNDPKCHEAYKRMAAERNKKKYGTERLQSDPRYAEEVQRKALQGRRIAGKYKFPDGGEIDYLGAYERRLLEFMDKVMKCKSEDIAAPGPTIKYMYQDKEHLYISDFYYIPYNLIIEVKDGGDNPNTNPALRGYKTERQEAKEAAVKATGKYNYVRQTNNDFSQIMSIMAVLKYNLQNECYDPIIKINEMALQEQLNQTKYTTINNIKNIVSKIYKKTKLDEKPPVGNQNCMLCVWCAEAQIRGIDILPRPVYSPRDIIFKQRGYDIVNNPSKVKINNLNDIKSILLRDNNSRYYVHVNWKNSTSGHEFIITNIDNKIYVIDGQAGLIEFIDNNKGRYYFKDINYSNSYIVRMDNKEINNDILKYNDIKYLIEWNEEKDIAYMESDEYKNLNEYTLSESVKYNKIYYGLTEKEAKQKKLVYKGNPKFTHKGVNTSLSGLKRFIKDNNLYSIITKYTIVDKSVFDVDESVDKDDKYGMIAVKIPFEFEITNVHDLDLSNLNESVNNNELSNLVDICKQLSTYEYILVDENKNIECNTAKTNWNNHRTLSVSDFVKCHGGICYDYVNYETTKVKAKFKTFFTGFVKNKIVEDTHTYLLAYIDDYVYWLECSWKIHIGVYKFNSEDEAISYIVNILRRDNMEDFTVEYKPNSSLVGISVNDFITKMIDLPDYKYKNIKNPKCENIYKIKLDNNGNIIEEKSKSLNESILFNEKDIYYNKDKFDSGEINLCFITGHSGSGKSTMARDMQKNNVEHYELDDLQCIKDHFTMSQLKEYGDLIYSYFNGPGKKFYITYKELVDNKIPGSEYEDKLFPGFVHYAMQYAKSHKDRKYVIEGVWLFCNDDNGSPWFKPEEFKDYAFYIKGTSMIVSKWRAAKRDAEDNDNSFDRLRYSSKDFFFNNWKWYFIDEKQINVFRDYFKKISVNESVSLYNSSKDFKYNGLSKYKMIIVGEMHYTGMVDVYRKLLSTYKFDYFIAEFADMDRSFTREELKQKMDNCTRGSYESDPSRPCDDQYNYWLYKIAYDFNIPLIGCNPIDKKHKNMNEEDRDREAYMLSVIKEFESKGRCLVQLGDHHLRSIPITKEFLEYCNDTTDDRGIYKNIDDLVVENSSPIWDEYNNKPNVLLLRVKSEYDNEINFMKNINESLLYESDDASKLDKNFKHKSGIEFDIVDIRDKKVKENIDEIKGKYKDYFKGFAAFEKGTDNFAGFIRIWPDWVLEEKYHGNLISPVEVKSKYRGYGLGRLLVEKSMEKFNANMLMVAKDNEVAINMYKKLGFSISQNTKWKNEDYYIMTTNTVKLLKSTNKITEDMSGTIGAALAPTTKGANIIKPLPVPTPYESDPDHYLVINTRPDQKLSYSITRDPLQYTLYSVDPQEKGFYKVFKSDKGKISKNYLTFKIKDKKKAKELYENLTELYKRNLTFMDHGLSSDVNENYIYSYLTDGNNIITPDQILFDNRFELVRSFEESVNYESSKIYNYLLNGYSIEDELNILSEQVKELEEDINE